MPYVCSEPTGGLSIETNGRIVAFGGWTHWEKILSEDGTSFAFSLVADLSIESLERNHEHNLPSSHHQEREADSCCQPCRICGQAPNEGFSSVVPIEILRQFHTMKPDQLQAFPALVAVKQKIFAQTAPRSVSPKGLIFSDPSV